MEVFDIIDLGFLDQFQQDGCVFNVKLVECFLLSEVLCWWWFKCLDDVGLIEGYYVVFDCCKFGMGVMVYVQIMCI